LKKLNCFIILIALLFISCTEKKEQPTAKKEESPKRTDVITHDLQKSMKPEQILDSLKKGNERFASGQSTQIDYTSQVIKTENSQYPSAVILSCLDSRVPVETVFNLGIGDVFVARVAGNVADTDVLASIEYGCKVVGSKVVVVLGHSNCGAVKSAIDDVKLGNITKLLAKIRPAVDSLSDYPGEKTSKNNEFISKVTEENVRLTMDYIRKNSPILKEMEDKGEIDIIGGIYYLDNGKVSFFQ
jgi:carbonic anhydrase